MVTANVTLKSEPLPKHLPAQAAELIALTKACKPVEGKTVNIYTVQSVRFWGNP